MSHTDINIQRLSQLSMLDLSPSEEAQMVAEIKGIMTMIETLSSADTASATPLAHPLEQTQPLREDVAQTCHSRDALQKLAPQTEDGLYIVPQFIEEK